MAVSNEQAHDAAMQSRNVLNCACADVAAWLVAAARELHHSLIPPVDMVLHAYKEDLKSNVLFLNYQDSSFYYLVDYLKCVILD